jgi:hypothetical protein
MAELRDPIGDYAKGRRGCGGVQGDVGAFNAVNTRNRHPIADQLHRQRGLDVRDAGRPIERWFVPHHGP